MTKKLIAVVCVLLLAVSLGGCFIREQINKKIGEAITEGILDQAISGGDIDIDGDKFVFKGDDGEEFTIGGGEWPKGRAADLLPSLHAGTISSVMNSETYCLIVIADTSESDYNSYLQDFQNAGFSQNTATLDSDGMLYYYASYDDLTNGTLTYSRETKEMTIMVNIAE